MYDFDMKQLLDTFNGDPEKLANAFADALNDELANQRKANRLDTLAQDVADVWEEFVDEYFDGHGMPGNLSEEDFYIEADSVKALMELMVRLTPYLELFKEYVGKLEDLGEKAEAKAINIKNEVTDEYADVMNRFFKKNNIS